MSQVFVGNALDIVIYEPGKNGRDATAQGNELDLNINSTVLFLVTPISVEPPEEAAVVAGGIFMLIRTPDILHFGDLGSTVAAVFPGLIHRKEPNIELRIVDDGNDRFAVQPKIKLEVVSLPVQYLGPNHIRLVDIRMALEVLHQGQRLRKIHSGHKDRGHPVVYQTIGD